MTTTCTKIAYPNAARAAAALQHLRAMPGRKERGIYPCPRCHRWHLTSAAPNRWLQRWASDAQS